MGAPRYPLIEINTPPNLKAFNSKTGRSVIFTDLNPQFRQLKFAPVSVIDK